MIISRSGVGGGLLLGWVTACMAIAVWSANDDYRERHAAVSVEPRTAAELAMTLDLSVDVWSDEVSTNPVVVLSPAGLAILAAKGVPHRIVSGDIQADADRERLRLEQRTTVDWFSEYRDVREVSDYMDRLSDRHPTVARVRELGTSIEGQPIRAIEVARGGKLRLVLDGGHHAREWISVMVPICIADRLARGANSDPRIRTILDSVSFVIVPTVNPDGYRHSWNVDRYWRKNRRGGYGVDLNRNYSVAWGEAGSSGDRRSQNYRGEYAFSEPETRAMKDLFASEPITAHVDFHSFSQVIVYPWSYQRTPPPERAKFAAIADRMSTAMYAQHGEPYKIRPGAELSVGAGGTSTDWSYGEHGALSFIVELRPAKGPGGFVLPPEQIVPTCDEGLAAVLELAEWTIRDAGQR